MPKNYGLLIEPIVIDENYVLGGYGSLGGEQYQPDGQWDAFLPKEEVQNLNGIEPYACVSYSTLNCIEILIRRQFGEERNYSDRFLAAVSGTAAQKGNSLQRVSETLRGSGVTMQDAWPFNRDIDSFAKFYSEVPAELYALAKEFVGEFKYEHEYVPCTPEALKEALAYSPLNIATYAWARDADGLYFKPVGAADNHSPVLYGYVEGQYWKIFDSYDNTHKKMRWDTQFAQAKRHKLTRQIAVESFWQQFLKLMKELFSAPSDVPVKQPETPQDEPKPTVPTIPPAPVQESKLGAFCEAIKAHEGWFPGSRSFRNNNPGNCRYSSVGYLAIYKPVLKDKDGFAVFKDYATGWLYLQNLVRTKIGEHPDWTLLQFFSNYAPAEDHNDPNQYAAAVGKWLGVDYKTYRISQLI